VTRRARGNAQRPGGGPIQSRAHRGAAEVFPFYWDVPRTAKWRDQHGATESDAPVGKTGRLLVWDASVPGNRYRPLEANPALFRVLAELNPTEDNIKRFVQAYGPLGIAQVVIGGETITLELESGEELKYEQVGHGEFLADWIAEITLIREAIALWDGVRGDQHLDANQLIRELGSSSMALGKDRAFVASSLGANQLGPWPDVAMDTVADEHARQLIRENDDERSPTESELQELAWLSLAQRINAKLRDHTEPSLVFSRSAKRPRFHVIPKNLLGAIWLQFALAVDGAKGYRRCEQCGHGWRLESTLAFEIRDDFVRLAAA